MCYSCDFGWTRHAVGWHSELLDFRVRGLLDNLFTRNILYMYVCKCPVCCVFSVLILVMTTSAELVSFDMCLIKMVEHQLSCVFCG